MYYRKDEDQVSIEEFFMPFGGKLSKSNRWVCLSEMFPWGHIDDIYAKSMSEETGRPGITSRIAFGALYIKEHCHITDEETVTNLQENPYMQYFLGLHEFHPEPLFDPSMMVHFRKRFPVEEVAKINEYVCTGKWPEGQRNVDRKLYCKERGIRLSGPPLGRRKANQTDAKIERQAYQDSCQRNAIEGRNGNAKRRFGLDRLFSKLDETAKTEAALILLAMNACLRLARWLALFFQNLLSLFLWYAFSADPMYVRFSRESVPISRNLGKTCTCPRQMAALSGANPLEQLQQRANWSKQNQLALFL